MKNQETYYCSYCNKERKWGVHNKKATSKNGMGEHFIPSSCGSPIKSKEICDQCNEEAAKLVDDAFINSDLTKFMNTYFGVKPDRGKPRDKEIFQVVVEGLKANIIVKKGIVERKLVTAPLITKNEISMTVNSEDEKIAIELLNDILQKKRLRGSKNFTNVIQKKTPGKISPEQDLNLKFDSEVMGRAHAKMMLGLAGFYYPVFKSTIHADQLRQFYKNEINFAQMKNFSGGWDIKDKTFSKLKAKELKGEYLHYFRLCSKNGMLEIQLGTYGSFAYVYNTDIEFSVEEEIEIVINPRNCSYKQIK